MKEKLRLLQTILGADWIQKHEKCKLQCLGITLGDALVQELGMEWVMVSDEQGSNPAIRWPGTTVIVFPLTIISKRIERDEAVDVASLFESILGIIRDMASNPDYRRN